ncbi:MAG: hypothetical protein ACKVH8_04660 [Pirellulales bacterium]
MLPSNPFATSRTRPGRIPFAFEEKESLELLLENWEEQRFRGVILGPHGSGKSTLLETIYNYFDQQSISYTRFSVRDQTSFSIRELRLVKNSTIVIDGYEQLSWWSRWQIKNHCRKYSNQILVTAHQSVGLPIIFQTSPSLERLQYLADWLMQSHEYHCEIDSSCLEEIWNNHPSDLRECLFQLYHLYESQRKQRLCQSQELESNLTGSKVASFSPSA